MSFKALKRIADDVEVFVKHPLQRGVERQCGVIVACVVDCIIDAPTLLHLSNKPLGIHDITHSIGIALFGSDSTFAYRLFSHCLHSLIQMSTIMRQEHHPTPAKGYERHSVGESGIKIIHHRYLLNRLFRQLRLDVKSAYALYVVAKKVKTIGLFVGK